MDADEVTLAMLAFRKDALIANLHTVVSRWQLMEGAAYATIGLAIIGFLSATLSAWSTMALVGLGVLVVLFAGLRLDQDRAGFNRHLGEVLAEGERLKPREVE